MNFAQFQLVLWGRWRVVLAAFLMSVLLALAASLAMPNKYTASAAIMVDSRGGDALGTAPSERSQSANQAVMATQTDIIGSQRVALRVVSALKLERDKDLHGRWLSDTGGGGDAAPYIAQLLVKQLDIKPSRDSSVIHLAFTATTPGHAANVVNAFAQAAIDTNLELKVEPARQFASWFDARTKTLRSDLAVAQEKLTAYQRENGLVSVGAGQIDIENAKLAQLAAQLVAVQAARSESSSRQFQARNDARTSPDVMGNSVISGLRGAIANAETNLKQLNTQYGERHPSVTSAKEQIASLKAELDAEMQSVTRLVTTSNSVNTQREQETRIALDAQKARVLALMNGSNDIAILQRDVESALRALEAATTRQSQTSLESQVQQTNVYLLASATVPLVRSSPKILVNTLSAAAFGLLLGIACALWLEARTPIVRNGADLLGAVDLPMLVQLPHASLKGGRQPGRRPELRGATP